MNDSLAKSISINYKLVNDDKPVAEHHSSKRHGAEMLQIDRYGFAGELLAADLGSVGQRRVCLPSLQPYFGLELNGMVSHLHVLPDWHAFF